ncbi:MAG: hypothetical protein ABMA26_04955 [Limisphaerales bacterium]
MNALKRIPARSSTAWQKVFAAVLFHALCSCLFAAATGAPRDELFGAAGNLKIQSPEARHDFPDAQRQAAYEFLDRHLRGKSAASPLSWSPPR